MLPDEYEKLCLQKIQERAAGGYEAVKDDLLIRPLNCELRKRELKKGVYKQIGDIALALYQLIHYDRKNFFTSMIYQDELSIWDLDEKKENIIQKALENTERLFPAVVFDNRTKDQVLLMQNDFSIQDITIPTTDLTMLSTTHTVNGAVALFYPGVLDKLMDIFQSPFKVVFMNVNDALLFDMTDSRADRYASVAGDTQTQAWEMLSGKIYVCDGNGIFALNCS